MATKKPVVKTEVKEKKPAVKVAATKTVAKKPVAKPKKEVPVKEEAKQEDLSNVLPARQVKDGYRLVPLVPLHDDNTLANNSLIDKLTVDVNTDQGIKVITTGFLALNRSLDLLALSFVPEWNNDGLITSSDTMHAEVELTALKIELNGEEKIVSVQPSLHQFKKVDNQPSNILQINTTILYRQERTHVIVMEGELDLNTGRAFMKSNVASGISVRGFMLHAYRQVKI